MVSRLSTDDFEAELRLAACDDATACVVLRRRVTRVGQRALGLP